MIKRLYPKNLILLHGEVSKMFKLRDYIQDKLKISTFVPPNDALLKFNFYSRKKCIISSSLSSKIDQSLKNEEDVQLKAFAVKLNGENVFKMTVLIVA